MKRVLFCLVAGMAVCGRSTLESATFGKATGGLDPRIMQFALKYFF